MSGLPSETSPIRPAVLHILEQKKAAAKKKYGDGKGWERADWSAIYVEIEKVAAPWSRFKRASRRVQR